MPMFRYKAVAPTGETLTGQIEAASREDVVARLQDGGNLPIEAVEAGSGGRFSLGHRTYQNIKPYEDWFWQKNSIDLVHGYVEAIDTANQKLSISGGRTLGYDALILATGSKPNKFGWPGQDLEGVQGLYSWQDLQAMERNTKGISRGVIVGGGLIGIEVAEMLHSRRIPATLLVREQQYWNNVLPVEEAQMIGRHIQQQQIDLRLGSELKEILADSNQRVRG